MERNGIDENIGVRQVDRESVLTNPPVWSDLLAALVMRSPSSGVWTRYGTELDLQVGNMEETDLGLAQYVAIVASSVFEHVEDWHAAMKKIFDALKPGGVLYLTVPTSSASRQASTTFLFMLEPNSWRYALRKARQGADKMKLGIDFHQFTYPQLRRFFRQVGFSKVLDVADFKDLSRLKNPQKRTVFSSIKRSRPLKQVALTFLLATLFICVK